jgi:hypothetical protein
VHLEALFPTAALRLSPRVEAACFQERIQSPQRILEQSCESLGLAGWRRWLLQVLLQARRQEEADRLCSSIRNTSSNTSSSSTRKQQ